MRAFALLAVSALVLAACDAPDPASFHHTLRSDVSTGTHVNGAVGSGESSSTTSTHGMEQIQRNMQGPNLGH